MSDDMELEGRRSPDDASSRRGVMFDLGANKLEEFNPESPLVSRESGATDGPLFAAPGMAVAAGGELDAGKVFLYARMIGMDVNRDSEFMWIADEMARAELPPGWAEVASQDGGIAFLDTTTQMVSDEHPTISYYRKLFRQHKGESGGGAESTAPAAAASQPAARQAPAAEEESEDSSLDSDDSDYEERLARQRERRRRRRGAGGGADSASSDESDSDKENEASRRLRARERKASRKSVRQQIMEKAEAKSAAPVKRKTARDRVLEKAAEMSADTSPVRDEEPARAKPKPKPKPRQEAEVDAGAMNQRAAMGRRPRSEASDSEDEETQRLREEQRAARAKREAKQRRREEREAQKEKRREERDAEKAARKREQEALQREREAARAAEWEEAEPSRAEERRRAEQQDAERSRFRGDLEDEFASKTSDFMRGYKQDHPVAVSARKQKKRAEELRRRQEEEEAQLREQSAATAAGEGERKRLEKQLRKEKRRQARAQMAGYKQDELTERSGEDGDRRGRKKRGHRSRGADSEDRRQEREWERHAELQRTERRSEEEAMAKRRKQAELAASLEAMRQVFGDRDEKLLTIWLAEANSDVAAAINIGLAYDEKVEQRRIREDASDSDEPDPLDEALDPIALKLAETTHTKTFGGEEQAQAEVLAQADDDDDEEELDPEHLEMLRQQIAEFDDALSTHQSPEDDREERKRRKEESRRRKQEARAVERNTPPPVAAPAEDKPVAADKPKKKRRFGFVKALFRMKSDPEEQEEQEEEETAEPDGSQAVVAVPSVDEPAAGEGQEVSSVAERSAVATPSSLGVPDSGADAAGLAVGDGCEIYSRSQQEWQEGVVTQILGPLKIKVEYSGRGRDVDLNDPQLSEYFHAETLRTDMLAADREPEPRSRPAADDGSGHGFAVEDACEVFSRSKGEWVAGVVTQVSGSRLEVEYGDRTRSVNLDDPKLDEYFRSERLRLEDAPRQLQLQDRGGRQVAEPAKRKRGGLSAILRQEPDSAFAVAQQRLQQQAHELSAMQNQGFKGIVAKAKERAKTEQEAVAASFWTPSSPQLPAKLATKQASAGDAAEMATKSAESDGEPEGPGEAAPPTGDPLLDNARSLLAAMPDLDELQASLLTRLPPSHVVGDEDEDEADAGSRPVSREDSTLSVVPGDKPRRPGARVQDIPISDDDKVAAKDAMAEERARIEAMLRDLEEKAAKEDAELKEACALTIQMAFRRHQVRLSVARRVKKAEMKQREAIRKIWRGWEFRRRRTAAREWRKSLWEVRRAEKKALVLHLKRQNVAARRIQATFRGYLIREGHPTLGDKRVGRSVEAAKIFQKYWGWKFERRRKAIKIQAAWRGYHVRTTIKPGMDVLTGERTSAAMVFQGRARMKLAKAEQTKRVIAILVLQRGMKRYYEEKMQGSTVLQRAYRKRQEAKKRHAYFILRRLIWTNLHVRGLAEVKNAKLAEAALTMQRMRRGKTGKSDYLILRAAVTRIQRVYRGRHGRRQYEELNAQRYKARGEQFLWAVERLQARFRGKKMRKSMMSYFLQVSAAARIQRHWRGFASRKHLHDVVERWCASVAIQSATRMFLFRKKARAARMRREMLEKQRQAQAEAKRLRQIVLIQACYRGHLGRIEAEKKWRALNEEFAECYRINRAIVRIQRVWRDHDAHRRAYVLAGQIAAAMIIQKSWRQFTSKLRQSTEWAALYHPMKNPPEEAPGSAAGSKAGTPRDRRKSTSTVGTHVSAAQTVSDSVTASVLSEGINEQSREEMDAARLEQNLWVREHLNADTIWMKDETLVASKREGDANMAQFFYKRAKPLAAVRCLESALRQQPPDASVATRCTININIATVLSQLNEFGKASDVLESSIGLLVADVKAQEKAEGERRGSDSNSARETAVPRNSERSFALTALSVCYHNLAVQKLFLDAPAAAIACAAAALRLATDTKCLAKKHPWYHRMERTVEAARQYQDEGGPAANAAVSPRAAPAPAPSAAAYKTKTPFGPFHDAPREPRRKGVKGKKKGRAANMRQTIAQTRKGQDGGGRKKKKKPPSGRSRPKAKEAPRGRPSVEPLPDIDPDAPPSVLRHSGRQDSFGNSEQRDEKWSYLETEDSRAQQQPRALRRVAPRGPTRGRTPPEVARRAVGPGVRGGSAGSARGQRRRAGPAVDPRGRFMSAER